MGPLKIRLNPFIIIIFIILTTSSFLFHNRTFVVKFEKKGERIKNEENKKEKERVKEIQNSANFKK